VTCQKFKKPTNAEKGEVMKKIGVTAFITLGLSILLAISWVNCGGGGSSSSGLSSTGNGPVAVYIADAPSDEYDSLVLYIKKVMLIPTASQPNRKTG
jgi:hypothetical protein